MLNVGDAAPPFEAKTTRGDSIRLEDLRGRYVVLYFFPKAFTSGCTLETKGFQSNYRELTELGAEVVGVSTDSMQTQCAFAEKHSVAFPMIADRNGSISKAYRAARWLLPFNKRITYVIGPDGKIAAVYDSELRAGKHVDDALDYVRRVAEAG